MLHLDLRMRPYFRLFVQGESNLEEGRKDRPLPTITSSLATSSTDNLELPTRTGSVFGQR
jgi:hypothetical protein